jgi:hypothetical protein
MPFRQRLFKRNFTALAWQRQFHKVVCLQFNHEHCYQTKGKHFSSLAILSSRQHRVAPAALEAGAVGAGQAPLEKHVQRSLRSII